MELEKKSNFEFVILSYKLKTDNKFELKKL